MDLEIAIPEEVKDLLNGATPGTFSETWLYCYRAQCPAI